MSTTLPTIMSTSSIRYMVSDGTLPVLKTLIVSMGTSTLRTCPEGMSRVSTPVTNTILFIREFSFASVRLTPPTSSSELSSIEPICRIRCQTSCLVLV